MSSRNSNRPKLLRFHWITITWMNENLHRKINFRWKLLICCPIYPWETQRVDIMLCLSNLSASNESVSLFFLSWEGAGAYTSCRWVKPGYTMTESQRPIWAFGGSILCSRVPRLLKVSCHLLTATRRSSKFWEVEGSWFKPRCSRHLEKYG